MAPFPLRWVVGTTSVAFRRMRLPARPLLILLCLLAALITGCGSSSEDDSQPAPSAADFPSAKGKTIASLLRTSGAKPAKVVVAPAAQVFDVGKNRYPFGVFTKGREQVTDADAALYFARTEDSTVEGPYPAQVTSLEVKPAYRSQLNDPDAAKAVYVVPKVDLDKKGPWVAVAMLKGKDGLEASRVPTPVVEQFPAIPKVGEKAPLIHTPTAAEAGGDLAKIDTRVPPDQMHQVDFADVLGKQPIVLVFATPALCQSRVCGPVVDVAQQVADEFEGRADFIHMEVYNDNDPGKGIRSQLRTYHLPTEPWTFLIDRNGVVRDRIEGAYGVSELEQAMRTIVP
jgi:hypothetical protein